MKSKQENSKDQENKSLLLKIPIKLISPWQELTRLKRKKKKYTLPISEIKQEIYLQILQLFKG